MDLERGTAMPDVLDLPHHGPAGAGLAQRLVDVGPADDLERQAAFHGPRDAEELADADRQLRLAYRRQPADPALLQSARRLAAETSPAW